MRLKIIFTILIFTINLLCFHNVYAGPPFVTDDPEPVELHHWEVYLSSANILSEDNASGTLPHIDINYGAFKNAHLHLMVPFNYTYDYISKFNYSYSITEIGIKYKFVEESENIPQIGIFPALEIPKSFKTNEIQVFLPVWLQKSYDKITTYCGIGYWVNPGQDNFDWIFAGWQIQYKFNDNITQGIELIYHTKQTSNDLEQFAFNYGGIININPNYHLLYSIGHSLTGNIIYMTYIGCLITI